MFCSKRFFFYKNTIVYLTLFDRWLIWNSNSGNQRERLNARIQLIHHSTTKKDERGPLVHSTQNQPLGKLSLRPRYSPRRPQRVAPPQPARQDGRLPADSLFLSFFFFSVLISLRSATAPSVAERSHCCVFPGNLRMVFLLRDDGDVNILRNVPNVVCCEYHLV